MEWCLRRVVPAAAVATHAKPHAQQQLARDLEVEHAAMGQRCRPQSFGEAILSYVDGCISVELQLCCCRNKSRVIASHWPVQKFIDGLGKIWFVDGLGKIWFAHARASVCTLLLHAPGLVSCVRQHASCQPCT